MSKTFSSINPATGRIIKEYDYAKKEFVVSQIKKVRRDLEEWKKLDISNRCNYLKSAADILKKNSRKYGELITIEMGKPIMQAIAEVEKCALCCEYYAENAEKFLADEVVKTEAKKSYITFQPLGVILGIMPWNFPFWQVFRFAAPTLAAGNTVVLKHASNVPECALAIEKVFLDAGVPEGVFKNLFISSDTIPDIINNGLVDGISLTGSTQAGSKVGELAGKNIKKVVLELGGSDPFIVLDDADLKLACDLGVKARFQNCGQSCIAAKRFIVHKKIADQFSEKFVELTNNLIVGDPMDEKTDIGPLARSDLRDTIEKQLRNAMDSGARILTGGKPLERKGYFFEPTVIEASKNNRVIMEEEFFGPVATIIMGEDNGELLEIANSTLFGLGASVWSKDTKKAEHFGRRVEAGAVFVNKIVKSDPRLPFGGIKKSGIGRELSQYGIREFVNVKAVSIS